MKKTILFGAIFFAQIATVSAQVKPLSQVIDDYKIRIGEQRKFSQNTEHHRFGIRWNEAGTCGDFDMDFAMMQTLSSQDLQRMLDKWIRQAKNALDPASLMALALQRANPDLAEIIKDGIAEARLQYEDDNRVCQAMQNMVLDQAPEGAIEKLSVGEEFKKKTKDAHSNRRVDIGDLTDFAYEAGQYGIEILGERVGGINQPPGKVNKSALLAGFNQQANRSSLTDTSPVQKNSENLEKYPFIKHFSSPTDAIEFLDQIIGETEITTAIGENAINHEKPIGISAPLAQLQEEYIQEMESIVSLMERGTHQSIVTAEIKNFNDKITPSLMTRDMYRELINMTPDIRFSYINALANEFASLVTIDKVMVVRRLFYTGSLETSIYNNTPMSKEIKRKVEMLDWEIDHLEKELRLRSTFSKNVALTLLKNTKINQNQAPKSIGNQRTIK